MEVPRLKLMLAWAHAQVEAVAGRQARPAQVRAQLEEHQRQVARWEGRVARQLEKIVALQRSRGSAPRPAPGGPRAGLGAPSESSTDQSEHQDMRS